MLVLDAKTTYFDDDGKPLSGGRLRFFAFATTTPVAVYADKDYVTSLGSVVALTSAGWTATGVYSQQSVTVNVDRYLGMDEFGAEQYEEVKVYDYVTAASGGSGSDSSIVDTIDDLRNVTPTDGLAVTVKGYYTALDCFPRTYIWDADSSALDNLGTVIESSVVPTGRWLLGIEGPYVDCRIFGVMPGLQTTNSAFAQWISYCNIFKKTAYLPKAVYYLTSGGSITISCRLATETGTYINSDNGEYTLTINGETEIGTTLASRGLKLIINNEQTYHTSVWYAGNGIADSSGISLIVEHIIDFTGSSATYGDFVINEDVTLTATEEMSIGHISGTGAITWGSLAYPSVKSVYTSIFKNSRALARVTDTIYVDVNCAIGNYNYTADWVYKGGTVSGGNGTITGNAIGKLWNFGTNTTLPSFIPSNYASGNAMVAAYNGSTWSSFDMQGMTATKKLTRNGAKVTSGHLTSVTANANEFINCTIDSITSSSNVYTNCVVNSTIPTTVYLQARNSYFTANTVDGTNAVFTDCVITALTIKGNSTVKGGRVDTCTISPAADHKVDNVTITDTSIYSLVFDAVATGFGVNGLNNIRIDANITSITKSEGLTSSWTQTGTIKITNQMINGKATNWSGKVTMTRLSGSTNGTLYTISGLNPMFFGMVTSSDYVKCMIGLRNYGGKPLSVAPVGNITSAGTVQCLVYPINNDLTSAFIDYALYLG